MVGWWARIRTTTTRWRAALACRCPPRCSRWRLVLPPEAGIGQAPQSLAKAASERIRSGLSPTRTSISAAVPVLMPWASTIVGAPRSTSASRPESCELISASRSSHRRAMARRLASAEAVVEVSGPGRRAARCRTSAILPVIASSCSRRAAGAPTMIALSVSMAWVRALTAVSRATLRWRIISARLVPALGRAAAWPPSTARAAQPAVGTADLGDDMAPLTEDARQAGAVRSRALDAERPDVAQGPRPGLELAVAREADLDGPLRDARAETRHGDSGVGMLVGVDADDDVGRHGPAHVACPPVSWRTRRSGGRTGL